MTASIHDLIQKQSKAKSEKLSCELIKLHAATPNVDWSHKVEGDTLFVIACSTGQFSTTKQILKYHKPSEDEVLRALNKMPAKLSKTPAWDSVKTELARYGLYVDKIQNQNPTYTAKKTHVSAVPVAADKKKVGYEKISTVLSKFGFK